MISDPRLPILGSDDQPPSVAELGAALRFRRLAVGKTQAEVAHEIGVTRDELNNFELGRVDLRSRFVFAAFHACRCAVKFSQPATG